MPQERPTQPSLGMPVPSSSSPSRVETVSWVEKIDITKSGYAKLARGTLYKDVVGADTSSPFARDILENKPKTYLLREMAYPQTFPHAFRYWGTSEILTNKSLGQPNLI